MSEIHASVFVSVNVVVEPPITIGKKVLRNRIPTSDVLLWKLTSVAMTTKRLLHTGA